MLGVAHDHGEIIVLAAMVEAEPEAEPVGERHLLLDRLARIDGARALVLHHVARHHVPAVRGRIEEDVGGPALDPALERGLERLIGRIAGVERKVVAEDDKAVGRLAQRAHQRRQALDVLAMDLDQLEAAGDALLAVDRGMRRLDQRRLAHAARAPQQRIIGGQGAREAAGVFDQEVAHPVDAAQERDVDPVDAQNGRQRAAVGAPDERFRRVEIGRGRWRRARAAQARRRCGRGGRLGSGAAARENSVRLKGRALPQFSGELQRKPNNGSDLGVDILPI